MLLATAALTIALTGPGSLSLDALLGNSPGGLSAGLAALFWQQVFHLECDVRGRERTIVVTVIGD